MNKNSPIPLIITGAGGRMGKTLIARSQSLGGFKLEGATEHPSSPLLGRDAGITAGLEKLDVLISPSLDAIGRKGVIIDFTQPKPCLNHLQWALAHSYPMVIGTTGFEGEEKKQIQAAAQKIPIVFAPNMSVGVNVLFHLVKVAAQLLQDQDFDIEITEAHHRLKKDAPSGTAVKIAEVVAQATHRTYPADFNFHREGITGERNPREVGMQVIRGGDIVGEHSVVFCGLGEKVELSHVATNRAIFADGALKAAQWLHSQKPGLYGMEDVLKK